MSLYNFINRNVVLPCSDLMLGRSVFSSLGFLDESQWWNKEQINAYQNRRLQKIVQHAYQEVPFYKRLYDRHGVDIKQVQTTDDLKDLPIIQKSDIRKIAESRERSSGKTVSRISSGSTGEPLQYAENMDAFSFYTATGIRAWGWMGYRLGDKYVKVSQNPRFSRMKKLQDLVNRSNYVFLKDISDEEFEKLYRTMLQFEPAYLRSYPDPLYFFCKYVEKKDYDPPSLAAITTTGNTLYPEARHFIEETLNAKVYDAYSCEGGAIFFQTGENMNYHGADEYAVTEILNENGRETTPGNRGRLITTDLWNIEVPFIRYDTQDLVTRAGSTSGSKRAVTQLETIDGRDCDILITPDGRLVIVHIFTIFFESIDSVEQFQAIQEEKDLFRIKLVVNERFSGKKMNMIDRYWSDYFGAGAKVEFEIVNHIEPRKSGKRRFLIRKDHISLPL